MSLLEGLALHAELHLGHVFGYPRSWSVSISQPYSTCHVQIDITLFGCHTLSRIMHTSAIESAECVSREAEGAAADLICQVYREFNMQANLLESPRQCLSRLVDTVGTYRLSRRVSGSEPSPPPAPPPPSPAWTEGRVDWGEQLGGAVPSLPISWEAFVVAVLEAAIDEIPSFVRGEVLIGGGRFRTIGELTNYVLNQIANIRNEARPSESQITAIPVQRPTSHIRRIEL